MRRQYRSAAITHFSRVSHHITTDIPSKTSMVESFLRISVGPPGSLSYVDLLFCREQVSTSFCRKSSTGDIISAVLKTRTAEGCSLQGCIATYEKGTPLEIISWKFSVSFKAPLTNFVKSSFLVALKTVDCKPATGVKRGLFEISIKATFRNIPDLGKVAKCRNLYCYLTKKCFHHRRSPNNFKNSRNTHGKF